MLSGRIFPTFPSEYDLNEFSCVAYGPDGAIAFASGSIINFAFISDQNTDNKSKFNSKNLQNIKPMFSISIGLNKVTSLAFDSKIILPSDHLIYIGDIESNIYIYDYHSHQFLTAFSPNSNFKENKYSSIAQISICSIRNTKPPIHHGKSTNLTFFRNIIVLFKSRNIVSYSIYKHKEKNLKLDSTENTVDHCNYFNSFFFYQNNSSSFNLLSTSFTFSTNWEFQLESDFSSFSIDPYSHSRIFLYNQNKDNSFEIMKLVEQGNQMKPVLLKRSSLSNQDSNYSTIQCAQFSRHFHGFVFILTEHKLYLYNIQLDLFTLLNIKNLTSGKSSHFGKIIQFESDSKKLLLVYKTGSMALLNFEYTTHSNHISTRSSSAFLSLQNIDLSNSFIKSESSTNPSENVAYTVIKEVRHVIPSQIFVDCVRPPFENDRDDLIVILYRPFGLALFDLSRFRIVSCCPYYCDKTTCYSTDDKLIAYGTNLGDIRIRSIFDNKTLYSVHVCDQEIKYINLSTVNSNLIVVFGNDKNIGQFSFKNRDMKFIKQPKSFKVMKICGNPFGGLIIQRFPTSIGVLIDNNETFLSVPDNDEIVDFCFSSSANQEKGHFMILRKNNVVELYKYNKYTKYSFNDNHYNCSNSNFCNSDNTPYIMKRIIITQLNSSPTKNAQVLPSVNSLCIAFSGNDYALGFTDGTVLLLKTDDQTFAKQVEVRNSTPIVRMKYCKIENTKILICLTLDGILCELTYMNEAANARLTLFRVSSFTIINSSYIMVKNSPSKEYPSNISMKYSNKSENDSSEELIYPFPVISKYRQVNEDDNSPISLQENRKRRNADSSYSIFEKHLSYPSTKSRIRNFILNNPISKDEFYQVDFNFTNLHYLSPVSRDFWMILLKKPSMRLKFLYAAGENSLEHEIIVSHFIEASSPNRLPQLTELQAQLIERNYSMELFYSMIYAHRYDEATNALLYNPESDYFMENTVLATVLLGFTEFNASLTPNQQIQHSQQNSNENSSSQPPNSKENRQNENVKSQQSNENQSIKHSNETQQIENENIKPPTLNETVQIENEHQFDNSNENNQIENNEQVINQHLNNISEKHETTEINQNTKESNEDINNSINQSDIYTTENDSFISNSEDESFELEDEISAISDLKIDLFDDSQNRKDVSLSSKEQQYAMIKHAATQLMMITNAPQKFEEGVNLLRIAQLDSFAASILIQSNKINLAMKFIRGMNYPEKNFCSIDIATKLYKLHRYKDASLFFLSANEYLLALHCLFLFTKHYQIKAAGKFTMNYSCLICDVYFLKTYMVKHHLLNDPFAYDETMKQKCYEKIGNELKTKLNASALVDLIDEEYKNQLKLLNIC